MQPVPAFEVETETLLLRLGHEPEACGVRRDLRSRSGARSDRRVPYNLKYARLAADLARRHPLHRKGKDFTAEPR